MGGRNKRNCPRGFVEDTKLKRANFTVKPDFVLRAVQWLKLEGRAVSKISRNVKGVRRLVPGKTFQGHAPYSVKNALFNKLLQLRAHIYLHSSSEETSIPSKETQKF